MKDISEARKILIRKIFKTLYPILIPFEEQDCKIQAENYKLIYDISECVVKTFEENFKK